MPHEFHDFRRQHYVPLKTGTKGSRLAARSPLPSDKDPEFKYGKKSTDRPLEEWRLTGYTPSMESVIHGDFMYDWVKMNERRAHEFDEQVSRPPPKPTIASQGHSIHHNRQKRPSHHSNKEPFKMSRFGQVESKIRQGGYDYWHPSENPSLHRKGKAGGDTHHEGNGEGKEQPPPTE